MVSKVSLTVTIAVVVVALVGSSLAFYAPFAGGFLQNVKFQHKCLTVTTGNVLKLTDCDLINYNQLIDFNGFSGFAANPWILTLYGTGFGIMQVVNNGLADGAAIDGNGDFNAGGVTNNEKWKPIGGSWDGEFRLQAVSSGKCLTAEGGPGPGSYMDQYTCSQGNADQHQKWRVIQWPRVSNELNMLLKSGQYPWSCLDNISGTTAMYWTSPGLYPCLPWAPNHHWQLQPAHTSDGTNGYLIRNGASSMCLQVQQQSTTSGSWVAQWTCPDSSVAEPHFLWLFDSTEPETATQKFTFESINAPGMCLTTGADSGTVSGVLGVFSGVSALGIGGHSEITPCSGAANQLFDWVSQVEFLKPYGDSCIGPLECLSNSCSASTCQKGAYAAPCQTKDDCTSAVCSNGNCA